MAFPNPDTQFKPGPAWTGNAKGRPKGRTLSSWLQELLAEGDQPGTSFGELIAWKLIEKALDGDSKALKLLFERHDGRIPIHVQLEQLIKAYDVGNSPDDL